MTVSLVQNFYKQTVTTPWTVGTGNFYVSQKPSVTSGFLVISPNSESLREIVSFSAVGTDGGGDYVAVSARGLGGTTEQAHGAGEKVYMNITAQHIEQIKQAIEDINNAGALNASTTVKGVARLTASPNVSLGNPTITIATPAVVTLTAHGLTENDEIQFTTTGALPTGITSAATYYVIATDLTANTFKFSTTFGGAAVDTSGSQSGTHTLTKVTPVAASNNDPRFPTTAQASALLGAGETPGASNKFLTQNDVDNPTLFPTPVIKTITALTSTFGSSTTQFDITNPAGTTFRYTWDATGTDPGINATTVPVGTGLFVNGANFAAANKGLFVVTGSGVNYFEVTNASGVVESNRTLDVGSIAYAYIPPTNVRWVVVEGVGGGGGGGGADTDNNTAATGGGSGGYFKKLYTLAQIGAYKTFRVGLNGNGGTTTSAPSAGTAGTSTVFDTMTGNGGAGGATSPNISFGGTATGGDVNIMGGHGVTEAATNGYGTVGGSNPLGTGGACLSSTNVARSGYGSGGYGGVDGGSNFSGEAGNQGVLIITEYF